MKRRICLLLIVFLLCGCSKDQDELSAVLGLRNRLQASDGCQFQAKITADYNTEVYTFSLSCKTDKSGNLFFTVNEPESIAGISGHIDGTGGKLTFDDKMLAFNTMADGQISPVTSPWLMMKTLKGGYIAAAGPDGTDIHTVIHDSYREDALSLDIWLGEAFLPKRCEILFRGMRVLSLDVENFLIL